jgi:peptidoglycan/LPS O-acetylase OafA/YrhL
VSAAPAIAPPPDVPVTSPRAAHLPALDGLRGLAIIVVVLHNSTGLEMRDSWTEKLWTFFVDAGWIGVQLFFVLSGFLITGILLDSKGKPRALRTFYLRRSFRIFPLYYVFLIGRFLILPLFMPSMAVPFVEEIPFWLYVSNWSEIIRAVPLTAMGHFWSLAVEEQFYLLWPALAMKLRVRTFAWVCVGMVVAALASRVGMRLAGVPDKWMYAATFARMDGLAMGALVALALRYDEGRRILARVKVPLAIGAFVGLAGVMAYAHGLNRFEWVVQSVGYTLLAVIFALIVAEVAVPKPRGWKWLVANPLLRVVGKYSYAIYVFHVPVKFILVEYATAHFARFADIHPLMDDVLFTASVGLISFALAVISFVLIERPFLRLKDRLAPA